MYPRTVENGGGERLTFVEVIRDGDTDRMNASMVAMPGAGPPMHVHHLQEEAMVVVSGKLGYQRPGQPPQYAAPGETVVFAPGEAHRWWNAGQSELHATGWAKPALNIEYFLTALFESTKRNGGKRPGLFDAVFLTRRYRSEFGLLAIPGADLETLQAIEIVDDFHKPQLLGRQSLPAPAHQPA